jgi:hypothetical protein
MRSERRIIGGATDAGRDVAVVDLKLGSDDAEVVAVTTGTLSEAELLVEGFETAVDSKVILGSGADKVSLTGVGFDVSGVRDVAPEGTPPYFEFLHVE